MSWATLLADNRVTALPPSKAELDNLRSIVARSLKDVTAAGLSADAHFVSFVVSQLCDRMSAQRCDVTIFRMHDGLASSCHDFVSLWFHSTSASQLFDGLHLCVCDVAPLFFCDGLIVWCCDVIIPGLYAVARLRRRGFVTL
jgi:hypothetical protein